MPKFHRFPDGAKIVEEPTGDTLRIRDGDNLDLDKVGHLGDWQTQKDHGATIGHVQLKMPIIYVDDSGTMVLVPTGAYLHYGHEGFFVWSAEFHEEVMEQMED